MSEVDRYGVVGDPVAHSLSPRIHQAFASQTGALIEYAKFHVRAPQFEEFVREFAAQGGRGLNITVPHKGAAHALVDDLDELARQAAAVNTIEVVSSPGEALQLKGYNTDGLGLVRDITGRFGATISGSRVLLVGAGGAARGVVLPLLQQQPAALLIANRTLTRAQQLVSQHAALTRSDLRALEFASLAGESADIVINATSLGLQGSVPPLPEGLVAGAFCYDMSYGDSALFQRWARAHGASRSVDGLGMLIEQAAESFSIWRGVLPETDSVYALLSDSASQK